MNKQSLIKSIKVEKPFLQKQFGVKEIALFGSYARGEEKLGSDVDLLVSFKTPTYSILMGLFVYLESKLNMKIDIKRKGPHISKEFLAYIDKDLIYV